MSETFPRGHWKFLQKTNKKSKENIIFCQLHRNFYAPQNNPQNQVFIEYFAQPSYFCSSIRWKSFPHQRDNFVRKRNFQNAKNKS